jgi:hypothetical protein
MPLNIRVTIAGANPARASCKIWNVALAVVPRYTTAISIVRGNSVTHLTRACSGLASLRSPTTDAQR